MALEVKDGQTLIGIVTADIERSDLLENHIGNSRYGFHFDLPDSVRDGKRHLIHVKAIGVAGRVGAKPQDGGAGQIAHDTSSPSARAREVVVVFAVTLSIGSAVTPRQDNCISRKGWVNFACHRSKRKETYAIFQKIELGESGYSHSDITEFF